MSPASPMVGGANLTSRKEKTMSSNPINPATGLPMSSDNIGGVDVGGSPWGTDAHSNPWSSSDSVWDGGGWSGDL